MSKKTKQNRLKAKKAEREEARQKRIAETDRVADKWSGQKGEEERVEESVKLARKRKGILG